MPSDSPSQGRRHFHRSRRGHERRSSDRRTSLPQQGGPPEQGGRGDHVDVEQIMREIRSKIARRHGVDLTEQQIQELAARRLESILDPRTIKPSLLDQLRRSAGARPDSVAAADRAEPPYTFEDTTLYESPNPLTRFFRKLLNPVLKLFFNPNPLIRALHIQAQLNADAARREAERDQRQAEWNALHYELLQRVVAETAKVSLELQALSLQVESLSAKVDFNERRVRGIEGVVHQPRSGGWRERDRERDREREPLPPVVQPTAPPPGGEAEPAPAPAPSAAAGPEGTGDAPRRRRRRRRGRRGGAGLDPGSAAAAAAPEALEVSEPDDAEDIEAEGAEVDDSASAAPVVETRDDIVTTGTEEIAQVDVPDPPPAAPEPAPERVIPQLEAGGPVAREEAAPDVPAAAPAEPPDKM